MLNGARAVYFREDVVAHALIRNGVVGIMRCSVHGMAVRCADAIVRLERIVMTDDRTREYGLRFRRWERLKGLARQRDAPRPIDGRGVSSQIAA